MAVRGVPQVLEEMIYNLCDNAIAYNRNGGHVKLAAEPVGRGARVTVEDDGVGIPRDQQERVFERFYRVGVEPQRPGDRPGAVHCQARRCVPRRPGVSPEPRRRGDHSDPHFP